MSEQTMFQGQIENWRFIAPAYVWGVSCTRIKDESGERYDPRPYHEYIEQELGLR